MHFPLPPQTHHIFPSNADTMKLSTLHRGFPLVLILLSIASIALAHGHDENEAMDMAGGEMSHTEASRPIISAISNSTDPGPPSYFRPTEHSGLMLAHIVLMSIGWIFILPLGEFSDVLL